MSDTTGPAERHVLAKASKRDGARRIADTIMLNVAQLIDTAPIALRGHIASMVETDVAELKRMLNEEKK